LKNHYKLLIALVGGIILGTTLHPYQEMEWLQHVNNFVMFPVGQIFLRLLFMIVVPMVFSALILGVF
jgi:DAACS family dicarboxylate/amino acid:cation (Na+ or H+) symporter